MPMYCFALGTATTISVLDKDGAMLGGSILPGVGISLNALTAKSALLSAISLEAPEKVIGKTQKTACAVVLFWERLPCWTVCTPALNKNLAPAAARWRPAVLQT